MIDVNKVYPPKTQVRALPHAWTACSLYEVAAADAIGEFCGITDDDCVRVKFDQSLSYWYFDPDELEIVDEVGDWTEKEWGVR